MADRERNPLEALLWYVRLSRRYHRRRRAFFQGLHRVISGIVILSGMGAITSVIGKSEGWTIAAGALAATASTIDLVVRTTDASQLHLDLERRYIELEKAMTTSDGEHLGYDDKLTEFTKRRLDIESNEPPVLRTLAALCHNELCRVEDSPKGEYISLRWFHYLFAHIMDIKSELLVFRFELKGNKSQDQSLMS